jgi:hypothetical protein
MDPAAQTKQNSQSDDSAVLSKLQSQVEELERQKKISEKQDLQKLKSQKQNSPTPNGKSLLGSKLGQKPIVTKSLLPQQQTGADDQIDTAQATAPISKERQRSDSHESAPETVKYQEVGAELSKDPELEKWVEEVPDPETITLPKPVEDDYGDILIQATHIPKPKIILPIREEEMEKAFHHKIADSVRWMYEWVKRIVKINPKRVYYPQKDK